MGRSRGGLTTKIHLLADTRCRPLARVTSAGQRHDSLALQPLLARLRINRRGTGHPRTRPGRLLADKAYSSKAARSGLRRRHIQAVIPEPADQIANRRRRGQRGGRPPSFDAELYKQRNTVERAINKLRQRRPHVSYEAEALGAAELNRLLAGWLDDLLPEPLDDVLNREAAERGQLRALLSGGSG